MFFLLPWYSNLLLSLGIFLGEYLQVAFMSIFVRKWLYICFILKDIFTGYNDPGWQLLLSQYIDTVIFLSSDIHCDEEKYYVILLALLRWNFSLLVYTIYVISLILQYHRDVNFISFILLVILCMSLWVSWIFHNLFY